MHMYLLISVDNFFYCHMYHARVFLTIDSNLNRLIFLVRKFQIHFKKYSSQQSEGSCVHAFEFRYIDCDC